MTNEKNRSISSSSEAEIALGKAKSKKFRGII
jgi:hypothetical protein